MDDAINLLVYHVGSGQAYFAGAVLVLVGLGLSLRTPARGRRIIRNVVVFLGGILVAISATPLSPWSYGCLALGTLGWLITEWLTLRERFALRIGALALWLAAIGTEWPYHVAPAIASPRAPILYLIGDSISAGMGEKRTTTWPALYAAQYNVDVHDLAQMGATVASALKQAEHLGDEGLVLLEIGGNDLLGPTSNQQFASGLERLLQEVCQPGRTVVMLELPLPPFRNEFGRIQRELARQYGVSLIPKRFLLSVLTTPGSVRDGVHLSPSGHQLMAERVAGLLNRALASAK